MPQSSYMVTAFDITDQFKKFINDDSIYSYLGSLSQDDLDKILIEAEDSVEKSLRTKLASKKVYNILIESLQNIQKYLMQNVDEGDNFVFFVGVSNCGNQCHITTGNYILKTDVVSVESRLQIINSLNKDEIRNLYQSVLSTGKQSKSGGAGLGFIDMARRSSGKLVYDFEPVNSEYSFFTLQLNVNLKN